MEKRFEIKGCPFVGVIIFETVQREEIKEIVVLKGSQIWSDRKTHVVTFERVEPFEAYLEGPEMRIRDLLTFETLLEIFMQKKLKADKLYEVDSLPVQVSGSELQVGPLTLGKDEVLMTLKILRKISALLSRYDLAPQAGHP